MASTTPKLPTALRKLCQLGKEALQPQFVNNRWRRAPVSKRVAANLRKRAVREGTFGSFDVSEGRGWDPSWDKLGQVGTMTLRPPKLHKRERTREKRAVKIEGLMVDMDQKIDEYYKAKAEKKPQQSFENTFKELSIKK